VRVPALVIGGRLDRITRAAAGRALAAALPQARYVEFARAAHAPFLSNPARFARLLTEFLRGLSSAGSFASTAQGCVRPSIAPAPAMSPAAGLQARVAAELLERLAVFAFRA